MFDYDNDELGVFDLPLQQAFEEDLGYELQDEAQEVLKSLFNDEFETLVDTYETEPPDKFAEETEILQQTFEMIAEDLYESLNATTLFETLLEEYSLPDLKDIYDD